MAIGRDENRRSFKLQKSPLGLIETFDLNWQGRQPENFGNTVDPVTDVTDFYLATQAQVLNNTVAHAIATQTFTHSFGPTQFIWRVLTLGLTLTFQAADIALEFAVQYSIDDGNAENAIHPNQGTWSALEQSSLIKRHGFVLPTPLLVKPGWQLSCSWQLDAASAATFSSSFGGTIQRLTVNP